MTQIIFNSQEEFEDVILDDEAIEGCIEWLLLHEQTIDVGECLIESTAGLLVRHLNVMRKVKRLFSVHDAKVAAKAVEEFGNYYENKFRLTPATSGPTVVDEAKIYASGIRSKVN